MRHDVERFGRWAPTYERHRMQRVIFEPIQRTVLELAAAEVPNPRAILDVGCGTGRLLRTAESRFPGASLVGLDPAPEMVQQARSLVDAGSRIEFREGTAEALPFGDGAFDLVFSTMTYHHWVDRSRGASEVARVLAPGGRWLLADFIVGGWIGYVRRLLKIRHSLAPATFEDVLHRAGLAVIAERRPSGFFAHQIPVLAIGRP